MHERIHRKWGVVIPCVRNKNFKTFSRTEVWKTELKTMKNCRSEQLKRILSSKIKRFECTEQFWNAGRDVCVIFLADPKHATHVSPRLKHKSTTMGRAGGVPTMSELSHWIHESRTVQLNRSLLSWMRYRSVDYFGQLRPYQFPSIALGSHGFSSWELGDSADINITPLTMP